MMKVKTLQVLWHEKKPVLSVDFDPATGLLASCGTDKEIKLWRVGEDAEGNPDVTHEETLTAHTKTVNCVRFSPGGDALASGGDAGEVIVWRRPGDKTKSHVNQHGDPTSWKTSAVLRGHSDDVQDLAWAPGGIGIVTGSVDNECIVWDVLKAKGALRLQGHAHYVQGVAWDPFGEYVVSQSGDRTVRVFASRGMGATHAMLSARWCKHVSCQKVLKSTEEILDPKAADPNAAHEKATDETQKPQRAPLFHDDTLQSFFRRPNWSPCGSFLAVPAGVFKEHPGAETQHATYLYARDKFHRPALRLPGIAPAVCVKFSPVFYDLRGPGGRPTTPQKDKETAVTALAAANVTATDTETVAVETTADAGVLVGDLKKSDTEKNQPLFDLPFRVLFAVCTVDTVAVYDSSSDQPIAFVGGLHYAAITDAAWSPCGKTLVISSSDGYCSVMQFTEVRVSQSPRSASAIGPITLPVYCTVWSTSYPSQSLIHITTDLHFRLLSCQGEIGVAMDPAKLPAHLRKLTPAARVLAAKEAAVAAEVKAKAAAEEAVAKAKAKAEVKSAEAEANKTGAEAAAATETDAEATRIGAATEAEPPAPKRVVPEPVVAVGEGAASAMASFECRDQKRVAPTEVNEGETHPAKVPKRVAPTAM